MDIVENKAFLKAIKLLSKQDYSEPRLKQKLQAAGMDEKQIQFAISNLKEKNLLREKSYIDQFIRKHMRKGFSTSYIQKKLELEEINIDLVEIEAVFKEAELTHNKQIKNLISKKLPTNFNSPVNPLEKQKLMKKLLGHLHSKGHNIDDGISYLETIL
ncbi:MAG: hypothetical protein DRQ88_02845 [Epsilonproteobacteria bacterium]|nr:MAG: hypothetical protein DRQ89_01800 [Campylobacterota bacterium]RLA67410.1 MAG: hypothetical protein DRQ88_02845 [Campylobacterota bacterium]